MSLYRFLFLICFIVITCNAVVAEEVPIATDTRVKTLVYNPNEVYGLRLDHRYQSRIDFGKSESIKTIAVGDSSSWSIVPADHRIFIRPVDKNAKTNMMVVTNKYSYTFDLVAVGDMETADMTYILRFYHPIVQGAFEEKGVELLEEKVQRTSLNKKIQYNYSLSGHKEIQPDTVYDNGELTFFKFTGIIIPKIFIMKEDGSEYALEMLSYKDLVVVNGVYDKLILHYQDKRAEIIRGKS